MLLKRLQTIGLSLLLLFIQVITINANDESGYIQTEDNPIVLNNEMFIKAHQQLLDNAPVNVKGIYFSAYSANDENQINWLIRVCKESEINAVVIDIKDDSGFVTVNTDNSLINEVGSSFNIIENPQALINKLHANNIYTIARIVTFKDPYLANVKQEYALHLTDGSLYKDSNDLSWVNPYDSNVWEYVLQCAKVAVDLGFDEIQFDYIRFGSEAKRGTIDWDSANPEGISRTDTILNAVKYFSENLHKLNVKVSADVFGAVIENEVDQNSVGQIYNQMALYLDYISPMIYPSHYGNGSFDLDYPDLYPYECIYGALQQSVKVLQPYIDQGYHVAKVRPWLQDFTASWLRKYQKYEDEQILQQVNAVYDCGYNSYLLWNGAGEYHLNSLKN